MLAARSLIEIVGLSALAVAAGYTVLSLLAIGAWYLRRPAASRRPAGPVTVLKPLCGAEPGLYENLRSFCVQDDTEFQIVLGLRDPADPALQVAQRLVAEFPTLQIDIVVDLRQRGSNRKISNLMNMLPKARHDLLVVSDSDVRVGRDYLAAVTAPLHDSQVGLVSCIYHDEPTHGVWSRLGAMYVNEWYIPSVLLAWLFGHQGYSSGQTMCLRRQTLLAVGGFAAMANHLADDYRLCELIRAQGQRNVMCYYVPTAEHHEPSLGVLLRHEIRWMCTLRVLRPRSFPLLFFSFSIPLAVAGLLLCSSASAAPAAAWMLFRITVVARLAVHCAHRLNGARPLLADSWLILPRDFLMCWVWCCSFFTRRISWRGSEFDVDLHGIMRRPY
jgi:ceramide glucosyltransferase